jgi:hypothetical protein
VLVTVVQVLLALVVARLVLAFLASPNKTGFLGALATIPVALVLGAVTLVRRAFGATPPADPVVPPEDRLGDPAGCLFFALVEPPRPEGDVWWGYRSDVAHGADGGARPGPAGPGDARPWVDLATARRAAKRHGVPLVEV